MIFKPSAVNWPCCGKNREVPTINCTSSSLYTSRFTSYSISVWIFYVAFSNATWPWRTARRIPVWYAPHVHSSYCNTHVSQMFIGSFASSVMWLVRSRTSLSITSAPLLLLQLLSTDFCSWFQMNRRSGACWELFKENAHQEQKSPKSPCKRQRKKNGRKTCLFLS